MYTNTENLQELASEIFGISSILYEFSKNHIDTEETECLHTGIKILRQKACKLNYELLKNDENV